LAPKVIKEKYTPAKAFGFPVLLIKSGGCGTRFAQTVLAENSRHDCVVPVLGMPTKYPLFHSDLGVIGMAAIHTAQCLSVIAPYAS
jgi:hypothetical protein